MPRRQQATAFAEEQARRHVHLLYQAARALPFIRRGTDVALAQTNDHRNVLISSDHLPPTSPAMTTRRARPLPWHNSGYVLSLRLLASRSAAPSSTSALLRWVASPCNGDTTVASKANWHPPNRVNPSATTSNRRPSMRHGAIQCRGFATLHSETPGLLLPGKSAQLRFQPRNPFCPMLLLCCKLRSGGQGRRGDGHTGRSEHRGAREIGGDATGEHQTGPKRFA